MSLRYAMLGALAEAPRSGYDLVKRFDKTLNFVWWASHGAVYTELKKLTDEGLITADAEGPRGRTPLVPTAAGLDAVRAWLTSPMSRRPRNEWVLRVFFLWLLPPERAIGYLEDLASGFRERLAEYDARLASADDPATVSDAKFFSYLALQIGHTHERAMAEWADQAAQQVRARWPENSGDSRDG